jgi:hypothetical protein
VRFLISVIAQGDQPATREEMVAIDAFNDRIEAAGQRVMAAGLAAPAHSVVIDGRGAMPVVTDGPLHEAAEHVAGFWIVEVASRDEALRLATEGSRACNRRVELRAFLGG